MKDKLLTVGDVIELKKGMKVYVEMEERFAYGNKPFSTELTNSEIEVGKFTKIAGYKDMDKRMESLIDEIKEIFDSNLGLKISTQMANKMAHQPLDENAMLNLSMRHFTVQPGEYVVIRTEFGGGSTSGIDHYPDGHKVFAKKLSIHGTYNSIEREVSFYQSGSFTCMILPSNIQPIKTLKPTFQ